MLRPLDLTVLAFLRSTLREQAWTQAQVAAGLGIAQSSVHRALQQLDESRLLTEDDTPFHALLVHAVAYIYPASFGPPARGLRTAHSHPTIADAIRASDVLVWPLDEGQDYGVALEPLHPCVPGAALRSPPFHELMALIEMLRVGHARERAIALERLGPLLGVA